MQGVIAGKTGITDTLYSGANGRNQGQAGFSATNFDLPVNLAARMDFEKPRCPLVP